MDSKLETAKLMQQAANVHGADHLLKNICAGCETQIKKFAEAKFHQGKLAEQHNLFSYAKHCYEQADKFKPELNYKNAACAAENKSNAAKAKLTKNERKLKLEIDTAKPLDMAAHKALAELYRGAGEHIKALDLLVRALKPLEERADKSDKAEDDKAEEDSSSLQQAIITLNRELAKTYFEQVIQAPSIEAEKDMLAKALGHLNTVKEKSGEALSDASLLEQLAWFYYRNEKFSDAEKYFEVIEEQHRKEGNIGEEMRQRRNIAWCLYGQKEFKQAWKSFEAVRRLSKKIQPKASAAPALEDKVLAALYIEQAKGEHVNKFLNKAKKQLVCAKKQLERSRNHNDKDIKNLDEWQEVVSAAKSKYKNKNRVQRLLEKWPFKIKFVAT